MKLSSPHFIDGSAIPSLYTCQGANRSPALRFEDVPSNAQSLALIVDDPDAPMETWTHWTLWNLAANTQELPEGHQAPAPAVEGKTDFGTNGYGGPCPPSGNHRYFFKLYALSTVLDLSQDSNPLELAKDMEGKILATAVLMGTYQKI